MIIRYIYRVYMIMNINSELVYVLAPALKLNAIMHVIIISMWIYNKQIGYPFLYI